MESYIARLRLGDLLDDSGGGVVLSDLDTLPTDKADKKRADWLIQNNRKAAGIKKKRVKPLSI